MEPRENREFYASETQRDILVSLVENPDLARAFFLTGGTALAVFYLHHRVSNDLDLFTRENVELPEIGFWAKRIWPADSRTLRQGPQFLSMIIKGTRVDWVCDPISDPGERPGVWLTDRHRVCVDSIQSIVSNKLCAVVSRFEPKDFVDLYCILKTCPDMDIPSVFKAALLKDAIFEDPPTAAFQMEEGLRMMESDLHVLPPLKRTMDWQDFGRFYRELAQYLYDSIR
jgi:hypothetical protein